ncbi:MAG: integrin alpha, partial [Thermodesulfobacteriota bacterium]|nr:integrin alpha [Thermodesulfobacteriota bacterium]
MRCRLSLSLVGLGLLIFFAVQCNATVTLPELNGNERRVEAKEGSEKLPVAASDSWLTTVQQGILQSEYEITGDEDVHSRGQETVYQAPNRAHNFRTYFDSGGVRMVPRTSAKYDWIWGLDLIGYGLYDHLQSVIAPKLRVHKNRIEYSRGSITEWYMNDERGLEQGFTLHVPPEYWVTNHEEEILLRMALAGNLKACMKSDKELSFQTADGINVMQFGDLKVFDSKNRTLTARFNLEGNMVDILIDAKGAAFPITVDPLATSYAWTAGPDQAGAYFGQSVSTAGDVNGDGYSDVIVGAGWYDNGENNEGRAFVYHGSPSGLSMSADWTAESDQAGAYFGHSVSTAGDVNGDGYSDVIVGANLYDNGESNEGGAFVYHGSPSGLSTSADWTAESNERDARLGQSVSTAGDVNGDGYSD